MNWCRDNGIWESRTAQGLSSLPELPAWPELTVLVENDSKTIIENGESNTLALQPGIVELDFSLVAFESF